MKIFMDGLKDIFNILGKDKFSMIVYLSLIGLVAVFGVIFIVYSLKNKQVKLQKSFNTINRQILKEGLPFNTIAKMTITKANLNAEMLADKDYFENYINAEYSFKKISKNRSRFYNNLSKFIVALSFIFFIIEYKTIDILSIFAPISILLIFYIFDYIIYAINKFQSRKLLIAKETILLTLKKQKVVEIIKEENQFQENNLENLEKKDADKELVDSSSELSKLDVEEKPKFEKAEEQVEEEKPAEEKIENPILKAEEFYKNGEFSTKENIERIENLSKTEAPSMIDEILFRVKKISLNGASREEMKSLALLVEREKIRSKDRTVEERQKLNEALCELLRVMSRYNAR